MQKGGPGPPSGGCYRDPIPQLVLRRPFQHLFTGNLSGPEGYHLIRPMVYVPEIDIKKAVSRHDIPVVFNPCPANGYTKREYIKNLLHDISGDIPNVHEQILSALKKGKVRKLWDN